MITVITGVSRGIGYATIKAAASKGHFCVGLTRNKDVLDDSLLKHESIHIIEVDWNDVSMICSKVKSVIGNSAIDILINNAATIEVKALEELTAESFRAQFETNTILPFELTKQLLVNRLFANQAHVLNISSMAGYQDSEKFPGLGAYSASKAALACITQSMAAEWADRLTINCLCLGAVNTDMLKSAFPTYIAEINDVQMASFILNFAENSGEVMNGQVIPVKKSDPK